MNDTIYRSATHGKMSHGRGNMILETVPVLLTYQLSQSIVAAMVSMVAASSGKHLQANALITEKRSMSFAALQLY